MKLLTFRRQGYTGPRISNANSLEWFNSQDNNVNFGVRREP